MASILLYALTAALYAVLAGYLWNTRWIKGRTTALSVAERGAMLVPGAMHSYLLWTVLFDAPELHFGFGHALSVMLWLAVTIYWLENLFVRVEGMQPLILGLAAICAPLPALFPGFPSPAYANSLEFRMHLTLGMLAYSLFTLAALHALLMTVIERRLHGRNGPAHAGASRLTGPLFSLPPLLTLESLLFQIIAMGFVLLTLTLVTGAIFSETLFGQAIRFGHKTLFAIISWVIFAVLLAGRYLYGWRGRMALRYTLAGFITLLLAYVGSRFVLEVILHRPIA